MTFSISEFQAEVSTRGLARQNRFEVIIPNVNFLRGADESLLTLFCQSASIPGATVALKKQNLFGPAHLRPANINYGETFSASFLCDRGMWVKNLFDIWIHRVINPSSFTVAYKYEYARDIIVNQVDDSGTPTYSVKLIDAFPVSLGAMALNQSALDRFHMLPVTFAYRYWETDYVRNSEIYDVSVTPPLESIKPWGSKIAVDAPDLNIGEVGSSPPNTPVPGAGGNTSRIGFGA